MAEENNKPEALQEHKEEKKKGTLESVIDELWSFGKKAIAVGAIAAMPFLYNFYDPSHVARAAVTTYGFAAAKTTANIVQKKDPLEGLVWQGATGAILSYPLAEGFRAVNNLESRMMSEYGLVATKAAKAGAFVFGVQPAVTTGRTALNYGLGKKFRENWWPSVKNTFKWLGLYGALNVTYLYQYGLLVQMITSAIGSYTINLVESLRRGKGSVKNLFSALNPVPYITATASATSKLARNVFYGIPNAMYAIGSSIRDLYKTSPKPAAPPKSAPETSPTK